MARTQVLLTLAALVCAFAFTATAHAESDASSLAQQTADADASSLRFRTEAAAAASIAIEKQKHTKLKSRLRSRARARGIKFDEISKFSSSFRKVPDTKEQGVLDKLKGESELFKEKMDKNFAYHSGTEHQVYVGGELPFKPGSAAGATKPSFPGLDPEQDKMITGVLSILGRFHDTGYAVAAKAGGFDTPTESDNLVAYWNPDMKFKTQKADGTSDFVTVPARKSSRDHEEFSICNFLIALAKVLNGAKDLPADSIFRNPAYIGAGILGIMGTKPSFAGPNTHTYHRLRSRALVSKLIKDAKTSKWKDVATINEQDPALELDITPATMLSTYAWDKEYIFGATGCVGPSGPAPDVLPALAEALGVKDADLPAFLAKLVYPLMADAGKKTQVVSNLKGGAAAATPSTAAPSAAPAPAAGDVTLEDATHLGAMASLILGGMDFRHIFEHHPMCPGWNVYNEFALQGGLGRQLPFLPSKHKELFDSAVAYICQGGKANAKAFLENLHTNIDAFAKDQVSFGIGFVLSSHAARYVRAFYDPPEMLLRAMEGTVKSAFIANRLMRIKLPAEPGNTDTEISKTFEGYRTAIEAALTSQCKLVRKIVVKDPSKSLDTTFKDIAPMCAPNKFDLNAAKRYMEVVSFFTAVWQPDVTKGDDVYAAETVETQKYNRDLDAAKHVPLPPTKAQVADVKNYGLNWEDKDGADLKDAKGNKLTGWKHLPLETFKAPDGVDKKFAPEVVAYLKDFVPAPPAKQ